MAWPGIGVSVCAARMAEGKDAGGFHYDTSACDNGPPTDKKRRLIREGGPASRVRDHVRPLDPGGGAVSTVSPQRMRTDDVFQIVEQSGGGSLVIPPGASAECTEQIIAEDTPGRGCPHDDLGLRPRTGTIGMSEDGVPTRNIESPYGGGVRSLPSATGNSLPAMHSTTPVSSANGPQLGSWRVAVVRIVETLAGDASGPEFPRGETNRQRPIDLPDVAGNVRVPPPPQAGVVNSVGPVDLSSNAEKTLEPLEHMVRTQTDPAGQFAAVGMLSPSDCYPVGPVCYRGPRRPRCLYYRSRMLLLMGRRPHLTVTLLALLARVLKGPCWPR